MFILSRVYRQFARLGLLMALSALLIMPLQVSAQTNPNLGTSEPFAVIGSSTVTNTGSTIINGNLAVTAGSAVTGFPPGALTGILHSSDAVASQAMTDASAAYGALVSAPCTTDLTGTDLVGLTLIPGVYCFTSDATLTGLLTLDALGDAAAVWIFQTVSALTISSGASVNIVNGGSVCNVWWQVSTSATLGTGASVAGNILVLTSITMETGASLTGRAFALTGAVTLDSNVVGSPACITQQPPIVVPPVEVAPPVEAAPPPPVEAPPVEVAPVVLPNTGGAPRNLAYWSINPSTNLDAQSVDVPLEISIPALNISAPIVGVGLTETNMMDVPQGITPNSYLWQSVFWYRNTSSNGNIATFAGHVTDMLGRPAIFGYLSNLQLGDLIMVQYKQSGLNVPFVVTDIQVYTNQEAIAPDVNARIFGSGNMTSTDSQLSHLTLITCDGEWVNGSFDRRLVVYATRVNYPLGLALEE